MFQLILQQQLDMIAFLLAVITLLVFADLRYLSRPGYRSRRIWTHAFVPLLTALSVWAATAVHDYQRTYLRLGIEGLAPTYAHEMAQFGHAQLDWDTPPDDPVYLKLIERQKHWLKFNQAIADVYTMRVTPEGRLAFLVDSETDYDGDDQYLGDRESRTPIGEVFPEAPDDIWEVLSGRTVFDDVPFTDRWGTWVSAYTPIFADDGTVEGILGVDFPAVDWVWILLMSRCGVLGMAMSVVFGFVVQSCAAIAQAEDLQQHRAAAEQHKHQALLTEDALRRLESYQFALNSHAMLLVTDDRGVTKYANDRLCEISGFTASELMGVRPHNTSDLHPHSFWREMWRCISGGNVWNGEICHRNRDGCLYWVDTTIVPYRDVSGQITQYITIGTDITARKRFETELLQAARLDLLTGLPNRALFHERLRQMMARSRRNKGKQFAVMFLDFDRFKLINDSLGHDIGDLLLQGIATRLKQHLRAADSVALDVRGTTVARLGGDEFVVLIESLPTPRDAVQVASRLLAVCGEPYMLQNHCVRTSASIGIVFSDDKYTSPDEMLRDADIAMYQAKARGKARFVMFDASMQEAVRERLQIEDDLRVALAEGQFCLEYQPIVSLEDGTLRAVEALVRWNHPIRGQLAPSHFISIAEETRLIVPLSLWIIEEACREFVSWQATNPDRAPALVSVNLSRIQLSETSLVQQVLEIVQQAGMHASQLQLEVTESEIMQDRESAVQVLNGLKSAGIRLAMDDFGTGYSSLACLHEFPFDVLKIDRAFINNLDQGRAFIVLANAIVSLAENLGMQCVAEGVESLDQIALLQAMGCGCGQGFYFGRPVSADHLISGCWNAHSKASDSNTCAVVDTRVGVLTQEAGPQQRNWLTQ